MELHGSSNVSHPAQPPQALFGRLLALSVCFLCSASICPAADQQTNKSILFKNTFLISFTSIDLTVKSLNGLESAEEHNRQQKDITTSSKWLETYEIYLNVVTEHHSPHTYRRSSTTNELF